MSTLLARIREHARLHPQAIALRDGRRQLNYLELHQEVERLAEFLVDRRVGLLLENGVPWACADLALRRSEAVCVPMPGFFTGEQLAHLVRDASLDLVVTDQPERVLDFLEGAQVATLDIAGRSVWLFRRHRTGMGGTGLPAGTAKITYTSGTTGTPKGVCLSGKAIESVAETLARTVGATPPDRALSLLPLSTLLENIGGLYAPLWAGATAQLPTLAECGMAGSSGLQPGKLFDTLRRYDPTTVILVPQLLKVLTEGVAAGYPAPSSLRFAAVGGAPAAPALLGRARALGLPVYQGYGLSEAGSVVCLNLPHAEQAGSVGKPLPHVGVSVNGNGEVVVSGRLFLGYLGGEPLVDDAWPTGDLGYLDQNGYLHLTGRRKTAYATAYGRNVSPEWVEGELMGHTLIAQAAVFGEARPFNVAVLVPRGSVSPEQMSAAVGAVNTRLPDYARIGACIVADEPFTPLNGMAKAGGALDRKAIAQRYRTHIEPLYASEESHAVL